MANATITVEVAFDTPPGSSSPTWADISDYVWQASIRRGRSHELDRTEAGTLNLTLDNSDRRFDPTYPGALANSIKNPSFEVDTTGWVAGGGALSRTTDDQQVGAYAGAFLASAQFGSVVATGVYTTTAGGMSIVISAYVLATATGMALLLQADNASNTVYGSADYGASAVGAWQRLSIHTSAVPNGEPLMLTVMDLRAAGWTRILVDGAQFEIETTATAPSAYADGDQANYRWEGTSHNSRTLRGWYPNVLPMRKIRVRAVAEGSSYTLFTGFVESWPLQWLKGDRITLTNVQAADGFKVLGLHELSATFAAQRSDARVGAVLDAVGWSTADRALSTGQSTFQGTTVAGVGALEHLQTAAQSENGRLSVDASGALVFQDRHTPFDSTASLATFGDAAGELGYFDITAEYGDQQLFNEARVTRENGSEQVAADSATSQVKFFRRTLSRSGLLIDTDNEASAAAGYLIDTYKDPALRITSLTLRPLGDTALWPQALGRALGDRVTVKRRPGPDTASGVITQQSFIEGIEHDIPRDGAWQTVFRLSAVGVGYTRSPLTVGTGTGTIVGSSFTLVY
jgi:hypothetical protein